MNKLANTHTEQEKAAPIEKETRIRKNQSKEREKASVRAEKEYTGCLCGHEEIVDQLRDMPYLIEQCREMKLPNPGKWTLQGQIVWNMDGFTHFRRIRRS